MAKSKPKTKGPIVDENGVYHYRRRIPDDVRRILRSIDTMPNALGRKTDKREEKKRLGRDFLRAQAAWDEHNRHVEAKWAQLREGPVGGLTVTQREALAGDIYRRWLKAYPPGYFHAGASAAIQLAQMQEMDGDIPRQLTIRDERSDAEVLEDLHGHFVDAVLAERGLILDPRARWQLVLAAQRAAKQACLVIMKRADGDMRPDPDAERYPAWPDPKTTTLVGLHELWVKNRRPNEKTKRAFRASIDKLIAFVGFDDVTRLTTADIRRWCAGMKMRGDIGGIRIRDGYLAAVKAILNSAVTVGYLATNPAAPVKVEVKTTEEKREKDLRDAEIYAILRATFGPFDDNPGENVRNARRWVPWLLAYTGARVSEMTRLESRHIFREEGVDAIHIERSKTGRMRKVPIHQDLKDQGFLDFVSSRRGQPLFFDKPKLTDDRKLTIHRTRAEGLAEWIRTLDAMKDSVVAPNHGFRHRWRTECRRIFMDREVRNYLQGHKIENIGEGYGHVPLDVSAPWIEMFPRFDVSGEELVVHRRFDLSLLTQAAMRMAEARGFGVAETTLRLSAA
jgi:integrase